MSKKLHPSSIIWITPCSSHSAIGRYSALVTRELVRAGCTVTIASSDLQFCKKKERHDFGDLEVFDISQIPSKSKYGDIFIYNIGNNFNFHGKSIEYLGTYPGVGIFHDVYLYDLFHGYLSSKDELNRHDALIKLFYGEGIPLHPTPPFDAATILEHRFNHYPMLRWLAPRVLGGISHARFGCDELAPLCGGPITHIPLAYSIDQWSETKRISLPRTSGKLRVSIFGDINPNKRVESVLRAIGETALLRDRLILSLVGRIVSSERARLQKLARKLGVSIEIVGEADNKTYASYLLGTDIVSCLRYPATESASATAIEAMLAGKPTLVTDMGFYRDLPDDLIKKISLEDEHRSLVEALETLISTEGASTNNSEIAAWAAHTFSPTNYADQLIRFLDVVARHKSLSLAAFSIADGAAMLNLKPHDDFVLKWTAISDELFQQLGSFNK